MSNLVERLRGCTIASDKWLARLVNEAADEIERLEFDQKTAWHEADEMRGIAQEYKAKSERLEGALRDICDGNQDSCGDCRHNEEVAREALDKENYDGR